MFPVLSRGRIVLLDTFLSLSLSLVEKNPRESLSNAPLSPPPPQPPQGGAQAYPESETGTSPSAFSFEGRLVSTSRSAVLVPVRPDIFPLEFFVPGRRFCQFLFPPLLKLLAVGLFQDSAIIISLHQREHPAYAHPPSRIPPQTVLPKTFPPEYPPLEQARRGVLRSHGALLCNKPLVSSFVDHAAGLSDFLSSTSFVHVTPLPPASQTRQDLGPAPTGVTLFFNPLVVFFSLF